MKNSKLVLFESNAANFRLTIDTMYDKLKQDGTTQSTVYINQQKESGTFRPNCFLVFTYLTDDFNTTKGIYTTVPHMPRIRSAFATMGEWLHNPNTFIEINGSTAVDPAYAEPIVVDNLSLKNGDWLSLTLTSYNDPNSLAQNFGVAIQHSKSNGYSSLLSATEFDAINDLIQHLDFVSLENQAVIIELLSRVTGSKPQAVTNTYSASSAAPNYSRQQVTPARQTVTPKPVTPTYQKTTAPAADNVPASTRNIRAQNAASKQTLTPRPATSAPKINMDNLKDIEVDDIDISDPSAIDDIFSEE